MGLRGPSSNSLLIKGLSWLGATNRGRRAPLFRGCLFQALRSPAALAENGIGDAVFREHPLDALGPADDGAGDFHAGETELALEAFQHTGNIGEAVVLPSYLGRLRRDGGSLVLAEASGSSITPLGPPFRNFITHTSYSSVAMCLHREEQAPFASIHVFMLANLLGVGVDDGPTGTSRRHRRRDETSASGLGSPFLIHAMEALGRTRYYATIDATMALSAETKSGTCNRTCSPRWPPLT